MADRMDIMEVLGPMVLFIGAVCAAAALYFVVTVVRGRSARRREQEVARSHRGEHRRG